MSSSAPAPRLATWDDLVRVHADDRRVHEVIGGSLEPAPRPLPRHGRAQAQLSGRLLPFDPGPPDGGWWIVVEPDVRLSPHDIVAPDLAGWRRSRMPALPDARPVDLVPDWLCEVVSPGRARQDRVRKANLYLRSGVPHYWIVDPDARTLEAFEAREGGWLRLGGWSDGDTVRIAPFEAVEIDVGGLFPPPPPEPAGGL
jgi:Uma2 family endonuclease